MQRLFLVLPLLVASFVLAQGRKPLVGSKLTVDQALPVGEEKAVPAAVTATAAAALAPAASAPSEDLPNLKFGAVKAPALRLLLEEWRIEKAIEIQKSKPTAKYEVTGIKQEGDILVVSERLTEKGSCLEGPRRLTLEQRSNPPTVLKDELIGHDCCGGTCAERPPMGFLLRYSELVATKAAAELRTMVDPSGRLNFAVSYGATDEESVKHKGYVRDELDEETVSKFTALDLARHKVWCASSFDQAGKAACTVSSPSFEARYLFKKSAGKVFLSEVSEAH